MRHQSRNMSSGASTPGRATYMIEVVVAVITSVLNLDLAVKFQ